MTKSLHRPPCPRGAGFTLIELMVAIVIALFLVLGLSALYMNMKTSFNSQDKLGQLQDTERIAATMLATTVRSAAYFPIISSPGSPPVASAVVALPASAVANADGTTFAAGQGVTGTSGGGAGASDTIDVRYQTASGDGVMDCQGNANTSGAAQISINTFTVNASHQLTCAVNGGTPVALVGGVAQMTVLYGVDTDGDGFADTYLSAAAITAASLWSGVRTAQITLNFLNPLTPPGGAAVNLPTAWVQTIDLMNKS